MVFLGFFAHFVLLEAFSSLTVDFFHISYCLNKNIIIIKTNFEEKTFLIRILKSSAPNLSHLLTSKCSGSFTLWAPPSAWNWICYYVITFLWHSENIVLFYITLKIILTWKTQNFERKRGKHVVHVNIMKKFKIYICEITNLNLFFNLDPQSLDLIQLGLVELVENVGIQVIHMIGYFSSLKLNFEGFHWLNSVIYDINKVWKTK